MEIIVSLFVGIILGFFFNWLAGMDQKKQTKALINQINIVLRGLENAGLFECSRNEDGEIVGLVLNIKVAETMGISIKGHAAVIKTDGTERQEGDETPNAGT